MDQNASISDLFFYQIKELIEISDEILVFMVKNRIHDMLDILLRRIRDLIHGGSSGNDWILINWVPVLILDLLINSKSKAADTSPK